MTLKHLRIFHEVCRSESITKAAEHMNMSQPAVSTSIRELENFYKVKLFERMNRKIYLTDAGKCLLGYTDSILSQFEESRKILQDVAAVSRINIGSNISFGISYLPEILSDFMHLHPDIPVYSKIENSIQIETYLINNELDFAIVDNLSSSNYFYKKHIMTESLTAVCRPDFPLLEKNSSTSSNPELSISDFAKIPLLLREPGSGTRDVIDSRLYTLGITPMIALESISSQALVEFCLKGLGILILPTRFLESYINSGELLELKIIDASFLRKYYLIYHKSKYLTKGMSSFIEYLSQKTIF